jgi:hypothetical protein
MGVLSQFEGATPSPPADRGGGGGGSGGLPDYRCRVRRSPRQATPVLSDRFSAFSNLSFSIPFQLKTRQGTLSSLFLPTYACGTGSANPKTANNYASSSARDTFSVRGFLKNFNVKRSTPWMTSLAMVTAVAC